MNTDLSYNSGSADSQSVLPRCRINLMRGWPSASLLPTDILRGAANRVLSDSEISTSALEYGPDSGYEPLRTGLASWLGSHYHVKHDLERICITGGASQSIACILQSFTDPMYTQAIWVAAPCYYLACPIFDDAGFRGRLRAIHEDDEGVDINVLEKSILALERGGDWEMETKPAAASRQGSKLYRHVIYVVSTCANPSGKTMSLRRRTALVELARKHNALIISDDVYDFLQWHIGSETALESQSDIHLPRLCDIDRDLGTLANDPKGFGHAISNGSFSKIAGPGLRTGWVEATPAFAYELSQTGSTRSGGAPSQFCAAVLSDMVHNGKLQTFAETVVKPALKRRYEIMMESLQKYAIPLGVQVRENSLTGVQIYGGYFIWCTLKEGQSANAVAQAAEFEQNLILGSGSMFEVHGDEQSARFNRHLRLCFAWESEDNIVEGVKRLGEVLKSLK